MISPFQNPFLLGFEGLEEMLFQVAKGADSFPPYNVELINEEKLKITLAVAGYNDSDLEVTHEGNQLIVRGHQENDENRRFLHRGIAARNFIKSFILADGMKIDRAQLDNGLLSIDLVRPKIQQVVRQIPVQKVVKKKTLTTKK